MFWGTDSPKSSTGLIRIKEVIDTWILFIWLKTELGGRLSSIMMFNSSRPVFHYPNK